MKEIDLVEKVESAHKEYDPVVISEGVSITSVRDIKDGVVSVEGNVNRNGKNIGRYVYNEEQGRLFVNVTLEDMERTTMLDITETITAIVMKLVPKQEEAGDQPEGE